MASSIRRRSAAWTILLDLMFRSRKRASALWMMRARSCGKRGWRVSLPQRCAQDSTDDAGGPHWRRASFLSPSGAPPNAEIKSSRPGNRAAGIAPGLFLAVLLSMSLHGLFSMPSAMNYVAPRGVSVVCRLFVMSSLVVFGGLLVVTGGMLKMF
jgi:hypothetical protein